MDATLEELAALGLTMTPKEQRQPKLYRERIMVKFLELVAAGEVTRIERLEEIRLTGGPRDPRDRQDVIDGLTTRLEFVFAGEESMVRRLTIIPEMYEPCIQAADDLHKMLLKDLKIHTHHRDNLLILRTITTATRSDAWTFAAEDETADAEMLCVYLSASGTKPTFALPAGSIIAVKEPFFTTTADNKPTIRIDHPGDFLILDADNTVVPIQWQKVLKHDKSALEWKEHGNAAFGAENFAMAQQSYTFGLAVVSDDIALQRDLHRNRAQMNLLLGRFDEARTDAIAALSGQDDPVSRKLDSKALHRAALASCQQRDWAAAHGFFEEMASKTPEGPGDEETRARVAARLRESHGDVDNLDAVAHLARDKGSSVDHADFVSRTEVGDSPGRGRGLFAASDIAMGEVILIEKALVFAQPPNFESVTAVLDTPIHEVYMGAYRSLWYQLINKLHKNPSLRAGVLGLDGLHTDGPTPDAAGAPVIDVFHVLRIIGKNAFDTKFGRPGKMIKQSDEQSDTSLWAQGLWRRASMINHCCMPNANVTFIGDLIVVRATKQIVKGSEIFIRYQRGVDTPDRKHSNVGAGLAGIAFRCVCGLCQAKGHDTAATAAGRERLMSKFHKDFEVSYLTNPAAFTPSAIKALERLIPKVLSTYRHSSWADLPKAEVTRMWHLLCRAYEARRAWSKLTPAIIELLASQGNKLALSSPRWQIDTSDGIVDGLTFLAWNMLVGMQTRLGAQDPYQSGDSYELTVKIFNIVHGTLACVPAIPGLVPLRNSPPGGRQPMKAPRGDQLVAVAVPRGMDFMTAVGMLDLPPPASG